MLKVAHLSVSIPSMGKTIPIVRDISFDVKAGETYALVGESGCGKSMTALALTRLLPEGLKIDSGEVTCDGIDLFHLTEREMCTVRGAKLSLVFQEPATSLNPVVRVGDQILEAIHLHAKVSKEKARESLFSGLKRVGFDDPERIARSYPHELSGGQKQRIMIAMALAAGPSVLIADEPTTALDVTLQAQILDLLDDLKREKKLALLLITHDLALVKQYADRVGLMYAGELLEEARVEDFFTNPLHPYAKGLLNAVPKKDSRNHALKGISGSVPAPGVTLPGCVFADRCPACKPQCKEAPIQFTPLENHRAVRCLMPQSVTTQEADATHDLSSHVGKTLLHIEHLTVDYESSGGFLRPVKRFRALDDVTLSVAEGETLALVGESGSGKTTLAKTVLRLLDGRIRIAGTATLNGKDLIAAKGDQLREIHRFAQIVFQDPFSSFDPRMSVGECIEEGIISLGLAGHEENLEHRVRGLLTLVGLPEDCARRLPHEFSGGQRQRIALARALAVKPQLIICDEPTSALDVSVQAQILNLMREIQKKTHVAYLFITHNFAVVECMADRIAVMKNGRIVEMGLAKDVLSHPKDAYTQKLLTSVPRL